MPPEVATAIKLASSQIPKRANEADKPVDISIEELVKRLTAIRERIWRLQAMFAVTLSHDCAMQANSYLQLFQILAEQLKAKEPDLVADLVRGHESLLLSPPVPVKETIPIDVQRWCELRWEASLSRDRSTEKRAAEQPKDGLGWML